MKAVSGKHLARLVESRGWHLARINGSQASKSGSSPQL